MGHEAMEVRKINMHKQFFTAVVAILVLVFPTSAFALTIYDLQPRVEAASVTAKSVVVLNQFTGEVLYELGGGDVRTPASLVKLTTVLVALDVVPDWNATCTVGAADRVGGVQITKTDQAVTYKLNDLLRAVLIPSANDAATALARCAGLSHADFLARMQSKALQLGATQTTFVDTSGISAANKTTAFDMAHIANAAFSTETIRAITRLSTYRLCSVDKQCQSLRNTNQLLKDKDLTTVAGKTGTLDGAYNFAGSFRDAHGHYFVVVVLGGTTKDARFTEAKKLVSFASVRADWSDQFALK